MISTRDLSSMLESNQLKRLTQSLAMLDAILEPNWEFRYYSFNARWNEGEEMASMRDGSGNDYFLLFSDDGAILKGFDHESMMSPHRDASLSIWPGVLEDVPEAFASFLAEPAFEIENTTFCIWRLNTDETWKRGDIQFPDGEDSDGSEVLLTMLDGRPETYVDWAKDYYESPIDLVTVTHIYEHRPLAPEMTQLLNPGACFVDVTDDAIQIGYPIE